MLFKSAYYHSLDAKNRVFIPAKFREELGEDFVLFMGPKKCIYGYTTEELFELIRNICDGEQTKNEKLGNREIAIFKDGVTL